jgi:hypothetical protein
MIYAYPMALHGQAVAKLLSFTLSLATACCVLSLGKTVFDIRIACWAAAFFYTTPMVSWLAGTAYTDNIVAMFVTAAILAFVKWYQDKESTGWLYVGALLAGLSVGAKMNAAFGLLAVISVVLWNTRRLTIRRIALLMVLMAAVAAPWYGLTYYWTGNPVLPMLNGIFKSPLWEPVNRVMNSNDFGIGTSAGSLLRLPFRVIFNTERFGEASPRGSAGLALLIAFPFSILLAFKDRRIERLLLGTALVYWIVWSYSFQYSRYFVHILPVVCILAAATAFYFDSRGVAASVRRISLALVLIMQFPTTPVQFWNIPGRFPVWRALGLETRENFLNRALTGYAAVQHLNTIVEPGDRVIGVDMEKIRLYLNAPLETLGDSTLDSRLRDAGGMPPDQSLLAYLQSHRFKYILLTRVSLTAPPDRSPYLNRNFLTRFATVEFADRETVLYRLKT